MTADYLTADLYDTDGVTLISNLPNARKLSWQEVLNQPGSANFEVPLLDSSTASIADGKIVRLNWMRGSTRQACFSCRVQGETMEFATDGRRWLSFQNQPGALSLLSDASVYPEYGGDGSIYTADGIDHRSTAPDRHFGFMSAHGGPWYIPANWIAPPTPRTWGTGTRGSKPSGFKAFDSTAQWISYWDPDVTQADTAVTFGYAGFHIADPMDVRIMYAFDDYGDLWVDGQQLVTADRTQHSQWHTAQTVDVRLPAGDHVIAYYNTNAPGVTGHANPVAAILSVRQLSATTGNPTGSPIINTNATDWTVNDGSPEPAYRKGQLLLRLFSEANVRSVAGVVTLAHGWTDTADSAGNAWTDLGAYSFPIGTVSMLDVFTQMCEQGLDMRVDPTTMTLQLYKRLGSDKSGSVALTTGDVGGNLMSYQLTSLPTGFTVILTQLATGQWVETIDSAAVTAHGRIESGVTLGSVSSLASIHAAAQKLLDEAAYPLATATAVTSLRESPLPYVDFDIGDTIHTPARRNSGAMRMRVTGITVDGSSDVPKVTTTLVEDRS